MAARRCSLHGINFPNHFSDFADCPVCVAGGEEKPKTFVDWDNEPDDDWEAVVNRLVTEIKLGQEERDLIPTVKADVKVRDGQMWVSKWDVFPHAGSLKETDLFRIGQQVFEVLGHNLHRREYLVRPFSMTLSDDDLFALTASKTDDPV